MDTLKEFYRKVERLKSLNIFITLTKELSEDLSREVQHRLDSGTVKGPLDGVLVAIKDNFCLKEHRTTCASKMLSTFSPPYTATVVERLITAGAVIVGKTNMDEFSMGATGTTSFFGDSKNIWGSEFRQTSSMLLFDGDFLLPGGSSSGSALAVASGLCQVALGSDTGGSVRLPAALCGVVGFKPSYGLLSRHGLIALDNSMDTVGILAQNVKLASLAFNVMNISDEQDITCLPSDTRSILSHDLGEFCPCGVVFGVPLECSVPELQEDVRIVWERVAAVLADYGCIVKQINMPHMRYCAATYTVLNSAEVASNMARYDGVKFGHRASSFEGRVSSHEAVLASRNEGLGNEVRKRILTGNYFLMRGNVEKYLLAAKRLRRLIQQDFQGAWNNSRCDFLLTPATLSDGYLKSQYLESTPSKSTAYMDYFLQCANMSGVPSITLPAGKSLRGLPIGVQFIAPLYKDSFLLQVASWLEGHLVEDL